MTKIDNLLNDTKSKNFITECGTNGEINFKISQEFTNNIYGGRSGQYIAGEIIAFFSMDEAAGLNGKRNFVINKEYKTYFLILSTTFASNYLVCPLFTRSLLNYKSYEFYELNLGVVPELERNKILYADLSRCHFINKDEFHTYVNKQKQMMMKNGENLQVSMLQKNKFKNVIRCYKNMLNN